MAAVQVMPPGFRFHPTDEELVAYYLKRRTLGGKSSSNVIGDLELYLFEPWDLPGKSVLQSKDLEWYFFSPRDKKHKHGSRTNRATQAGYWKATGKDRKVFSGSRTIGMKKTLVYYKGRAPQGDRTDWVMHEYRMDEDYEREKGVTDPFVLCRIFKKGGPGPRNGEQYGAPLIDEDDNLEDAPLPPIEAAPTPNDQDSHDLPWESLPSSSDAGCAAAPLNLTEEKDVEVNSAENVLQLTVPSLQNEIPAVLFPPASDAFKDSFYMHNSYSEVDDILHPAPTEAELLQDILNSTEDPNAVSSAYSGSSWHCGNEALGSLYYGEWSKDYLELADLDIPLDYLSWHEETDWTIMKEDTTSSSEADTGIQIRNRREQPVIQIDSGLHGLETTSRRVRLQEQTRCSTDILNPQVSNSVEIQETEAVYRQIGTKSMVYTAYEQFPVSEVSVFMSEELGGTITNSNKCNHDDKLEKPLVSVVNSFTANAEAISEPLQTQRSRLYEDHHENCFSVQTVSDINTVKCKEMQKTLKEDPDPCSLIKVSSEMRYSVITGPFKSSRDLDETINMQFLRETSAPSSLVNFPVYDQKLGTNDLKFPSSCLPDLLHRKSKTAGILDSNLPPKTFTCLNISDNTITALDGKMSGILFQILSLIRSSVAPMRYLFAPCNIHESLLEKLKVIRQWCPVLGLIRQTNRWVCKLKSICSEEWQSQRIQTSCPGTMNISWTFLFVLGSASALLFCVSKELWRFAKLVITILYPGFLSPLSYCSFSSMHFIKTAASK